jgi:hypothetical protein
MTVDKEMMRALEADGEGKTAAEPVAWECFLDEGYFGLWCVRRVGEREFGQGFHLQNSQEAHVLCDLLNAASPVCEVVTEPVAWISFADNGNVRLWTMDQARAEREIGSGVKMTPLYAHPPSNNQELIEALRECEDYFDERADAEYHPGQDAPTGNEEMRMLVTVRSALSKLEGR